MQAESGALALRAPYFLRVNIVSLEMTGDELLIRVGNRMVLTDRAQAGAGSKEFAAFLKNEESKFGAIVAKGNIKAE